MKVIDAGDIFDALEDKPMVEKYGTDLTAEQRVEKWGEDNGVSVDALKAAVKAWVETNSVAFQGTPRRLVAGAAFCRGFQVAVQIFRAAENDGA